MLVNNAGVLDDAYLLAINSDSLDRKHGCQYEKDYFTAVSRLRLKCLRQAEESLM